MSRIQDRLREIPQVGSLLEDSRIAPLMTGRRTGWMTRLVQQSVADLRDELKQATGPVQSRDQLLKIAVQRIVDKKDMLTCGIN